MKRYIYERIKSKHHFAANTFDNYQDVINHYASIGYKYVGWIPCKIVGYGALEEYDLVFEKDDDFDIDASINTTFTQAKENLLYHINDLRTTEQGEQRVRKNLELDRVYDIVSYIKEKIKDENCTVFKQGKNYYCEIEDMMITINSYSYTIITAHKTTKKSR